MNYLIDTHILLWYMVGDNRIGPDIQSKIESDRNTIFLSNASLWEITIKDPFDRLIVAQSLTKEMEVITDDLNVKKYFEVN